MMTSQVTILRMLHFNARAIAAKFFGGSAMADFL
jgi:hypothetical protein